MINTDEREKRIQEQNKYIKVLRKGYKGVKNKPTLSKKKEVEESIIDRDNGSERDELRYNHNHGKDGRFTFSTGSSSKSGSSSKGGGSGSAGKKSSGSSNKGGSASKGGGSSDKVKITSFNSDGETNPDGSIDMNYLHISNKNTPVANNNQFGQDLEPAGEYMSFIPEGTNHINLDNYTYGTIHFDKPLQIEYKSTGANGWKNDLSKMFGGKTGKALSNAIKAAGYDAVVTYEFYKGDKNWVEIVNLDGKKGG